MTLMSLNSYLAAGEENPYCDPYCDPCCCSEWYVLYENVIVRPYFTRNNAYVLDSPDGIDGQEAVEFEWDWCYSPRIEIGWNGSCGLGVRGRYWYFDDDTTLHAEEEDANIAAMFAEDSNNDIGFDFSSDARFKHSLRLKVLDIEATYKRSNLIYSAGARYAHMKQRYEGFDFDFDLGLEAKHYFEGIGLTAAVEFMQPCYCGFSVFTKARGSLLYGHSAWRAFSDLGDAEISNSSDRDVISVGELQLGIDWRRNFADCISAYLRFAIEAQYWANAGAGGPGSNAIFDEGNYQNTHPQDSSLGFIGFNIAIGFVY